MTINTEIVKKIHIDTLKLERKRCQLRRAKWST